MEPGEERGEAAVKLLERGVGNGETATSVVGRALLSEAVFGVHFLAKVVFVPPCFTSVI